MITWQKSQIEEICIPCGSQEAKNEGRSQEGLCILPGPVPDDLPLPTGLHILIAQLAINSSVD